MFLYHFLVFFFFCAMFYFVDHITFHWCQFFYDINMRFLFIILSSTHENSGLPFLINKVYFHLNNLLTELTP